MSSLLDGLGDDRPPPVAGPAGSGAVVVRTLSTAGQESAPQPYKSFFTVLIAYISTVRASGKSFIFFIFHIYEFGEKKNP
jgi:hypothetical protein